MGLFTDFKNWGRSKIFGAISKGYSWIGSPSFINARNMITRQLWPDDPPLFSGERHLMTGQGRSYRFAGSGTRIEERLRLGGKYATPINELDALAKLHDIDFMRKPNPKQEFESDARLVKGSLGLIGRIPEAKLVAAAISSKMALNKSGVLPYGTFSNM